MLALRQFAGTTGFFTEGIVYVLEGLLKHGVPVSMKMQHVDSSHIQYGKGFHNTLTIVNIVKSL